MKLALGNINPGTVRVEFMQAVIQGCSARAIDTLYLKTNGPYLDDSRNFVVQDFLAGDCDELLFVDSDMAFTVDDIARLTKSREQATNLDILSGLYFGASPDGIGGPAPIAYRWGTPDTHDVPVPVQIEMTDDITTPSDELIGVDQVGTGFMLLHRDLLVSMVATYPYPCTPFAEDVIDGVHYGEDHTFCIRAGAIGAGCYINPHVRVPHYKVCRFQ